MKTYLGLDKGCLTVWLGATTASWAIPPYTPLEVVLISAPFVYLATYVVVRWLHSKGCQ